MEQNNVGSDQLASYSQLFVLHCNDSTGKVENIKPDDLYLYFSLDICIVRVHTAKFV